ncbi:FxLYD domain-containing protein [Thermoactinospora rubra]|uniref:FxLYD domain-containing protein n=1 Tax=Thermoactinospora rubra TaxID=1088767 RepID=UPI000A0FB84B|nr:FxLYD domain-containing protein [Thermoactinospora rubra]
MRTVTLTGTVLAAVLLAGCTSEKAPAKQLKPLALAEQTSTIVKSRDGYVVNWAGVLSNANPWHFGEHVVATVVGRDAKGAEVVRMDQPLDAVPPGGRLAFTGQATAAAKPAKVTIEYRPARWRQAARIVSAFKPFPVSRVQTIRQKDGRYVITGFVSNPYRTPAASLVVSALLRDASGKLLGGGTAFVDDVKAGKTPRFVITVEGVPSSARVGRTDVTARTWGATARPYEELALGGIVPVHTVKPTTEPFAKDRGGHQMPTDQ